MFDSGKYHKALKYINIAIEKNTHKKVAIINQNAKKFKQKILKHIETNKKSNNDINIYVFHECNWCNNKLYKHDKYSKCSNCKSIFWCSRRCQKLDWKEFHKRHCKLINKETAANKLFMYLLKERHLNKCSNFHTL